MKVLRGHLAEGPQLVPILSQIESRVNGLPGTRHPLRRTLLLFQCAMANVEETETVQFSSLDSGDTGERVAFLIVIRGPELGRRFPLSTRRAVLGRSAEVEICIPDPSLSRRHCELSCAVEGGQSRFELRDVGSTNGTFVNGARVHEHVLENGDRIGVGEVVLKFSLLDALEQSFHQEVRQRMRRDHLTGLLNLTTFYAELDRALAQSRRDGGSIGLLMLDVDGLKRVNDTHGHLLGAEVVRQVGRCLHENVEPVGGVSALYGGDEFIAYLPGKSGRESVEVAEAVRSQVEATEIGDSQGVTVHVSVCIGVAEYARDAKERSLLVSYADEALYAAKRSGRNRVISFSRALIGG